MPTAADATPARVRLKVFMAMRKPMFSLPGCTSLAMTPITKPSTMVQIIPMSFPLRTLRLSEMAILMLRIRRHP